MVDFLYTGAAQTWQVPAGINEVIIECWGAEGNRSTRSSETVPGGLGGYSKATVPVTPGEILTVIVGGGGTVSRTGGFGGGGSGGFAASSPPDSWPGGGGGGMSRVSRGSTHIVIAGGGGGGSSTSTASGGTSGGSGGGASGGSSTGAGGGTQSSGGAAATLGTNGGNGTAGSLLTGGEGYNGWTGNTGGGGGGGGGLYGGGGGGSDWEFGASTSGGGGSGYLTGTNTISTNGVRSGNGQVSITGRPVTSVTSPSDNESRRLIDGVDFAWTHVDPDGDGQSGWALKRRSFDGSVYGSEEWWNGSAWVGSTYTNVGAATGVSISDWPSANATYQYAIATADAVGLGAYSAWRTINPYEWWNGSAWVPMAEAFVTSAVQQVTFPTAAFERGAQYEWTVRTKDASLSGPYAVDRIVNIGGFERWGAVFI